MDEMIYNQKDMKDHRYGLRSSAATGCGWIAAYNVLKLLGYRVEKESLIRYFESQLPLIHGNLGTSFWGPAQYFHHWGFPVKVTASRKEYDEALKDADAAILFYHWRKGIKLGAHFVALQHRDGKVFGYNTFTNSKGEELYGESLEAYIQARGWFGTVLTVVKKP